MVNNVTHRFVECFNLLKRRKVISSGRQFCMSLDIYPQSWSKILKGERAVTVEMIRKAAILYKFNTNYLFLGDGDKIIDGNSNSRDNNNRRGLKPNVLKDNILHVPVKAKVEYNNRFINPVCVKGLDAYSLPGDYFKVGTYRSFEVDGDSMIPILKSGEVVICNEVEDNALWQDNIKSGYVYVIVTKDDILIKRVVNRIEQDNCLELVSENRFYESIILDTEDVQEIWLVRMKLSVFPHSGADNSKELMKSYSDLNDAVRSQNQELIEMRKMISKLLKDKGCLS